MNKIEELKKAAREALDDGWGTIEVSPSDLWHLTNIARLAYKKYPAAAESRARDFANYWLCDLSVNSYRIPDDD